MKAAALVLLAAVFTTSCKSSGEGTAAAAPPPTPPAKVATAVGATAQVPVWIPLTGQLRGVHETELAANANGRVTATFVERGSAVKAGQILATLDVRAAALSAEEAKIQLENAHVTSDAQDRECQRGRELFRSGAVSQQDLERIEMQCKSSQLTIKSAASRSALAQQSVGDGVIRAPFAGVISERFVDVGEYVHSDSRIVGLVDQTSLRVELTIPETEIAHLIKGAPVRFSVPGYPDRWFSGELSYVSGSVRPTTRDVVAEASVENPEGILRSGMFASVRLQGGMEKATLLPKNAVVSREGKSTAFVVNEGRAEQRILQIGEAPGKDEIAIWRGVEENEKVVLDPPSDLKNGQSVD